MVREHKFDCGELAIVTFLQAREFGLPYVLLPATVVGRGQLHTVAYNSERGTMKPSDLNGKKFGVRSYTQTTGIWVRGILAEDYGVDWSKVEITTMEDPHVARIQGPVVRQARAGDQAAAADADRRRARRRADRRQVPRSALQDAGAGRRGRQQGMGGEARRRADQPHGDRARQDRQGAPRRGRGDVPRVQGGARSSTRRRRRARSIPYRFGVEANRAALERVIDYSFKQQMITKKFTVDELFDDVTRKLGA